MDDRIAPASVAIAALMHDPADQQVFPIMGARTPAQLADALAAQDVVLSGEHWAMLDALTRPEPIFPYTVIDSEIGRKITSGGEADRLNNHRRRR